MMQKGKAQKRDISEKMRLRGKMYAKRFARDGIKKGGKAPYREKEHLQYLVSSCSSKRTNNARKAVKQRER